MSTPLPTPKDVSTKEIFDNPYKFLDDTLQALLLESEGNPNPIPREQVFALRNINISFRDREIVLRHLIKDGNVDSIMKSRNEISQMNNAFQSDIPNVECFFITFNGVKLLHDDGYVKASSDAEKRNRKEARNNLYLILGSWMAGVGTLLLFSVEIAKHYGELVKIGFGWVLSIQFVTFLFVALLASTAGFLLGVVITLIIQHLQRHYRKPKV